jgi:periplasmic protein TonB
MAGGSGFGNERHAIPVQTRQDRSNEMPEVLQPDDHLSRLLTPQDTEVPWYKSLYQSVHDIIKPEKLPPLVVTSKPVAVKDMWGLYGNDPKNFGYSVAIQAALLSLALWGFSTPTVQKAIKQKFDLIDPNIKPYVPDVKPKNNAMQGGGGGGAREPLPVSKGRLPKPSMKLMNGSNCQGSAGCLGNGSGGGVGSGNGGGFGPGSGGGVGGGVFRVGGGVSAPSVLFRVDPEYSEEARKAKYSGTVLLSIIVDAEGKARDIHVIKSLGMGLDEKAVEAVQKWKFKPGMKGGQPVNVRAQIEVNFRLL